MPLSTVQHHLQINLAPRNISNSQISEPAMNTKENTKTKLNNIKDHIASVGNSNDVVFNQMRKRGKIRNILLLLRKVRSISKNIGIGEEPMKLHFGRPTRNTTSKTSKVENLKTCHNNLQKEN